MTDPAPDTPLALDFPLHFHHPGLPPIESHAVELSRTPAGDHTPSSTLTIRLDWETYARIRALELFNLTAASRPEEADDNVFHHDQPLYLDLRLSENHQAALAGPDPAETLRAAAPEDPLLAAVNWYTLGVWQPVELGGELSGHTLRAGYQTSWFVPPPPPPEPAGPLFQAVMDYFDHRSWPYAPLAQRTILRLEYRGGYGDWYVFAQVREREQQVVFYSACPLQAPAGQRAAVAELLTRINFGLIIGNFEMDMDDGEIRFKTSVDVEGTPLTPALLEQLVHANVTMMDRYLPALVQVIHGAADPRQALTRVEI